MTERLPDRWTTRDLPMLRHIVEAFDREPRPNVDHDDVANALDLSADEAEVAVINLERGGYVEIQWMGAGWFITTITERALRAAGVWPDAEQAADQMLWFLERKVEEAATPEERSRWQKLRDAFGAAGRDFAVELAAAMASRTMGI